MAANPRPLGGLGAERPVQLGFLNPQRKRTGEREARRAVAEAADRRSPT